MVATILIVDDNAQLRALLRGLAAQASDLHVVGEAEDGAEAMRLAQALQPDIVLLALAMPRVNGLEALRRITEEDGGADAFLLKKTLVTVLPPTIQRLRGSLPPPQAS